MLAIAIKRDPQKWETAKRDAVSRMGGKHSARAMQLASKIYKDRGGEYAGKKPPPSDNSLRTWTKQNWKWSGGDEPGQGGRGVYLPSRAVSALRSTSQGRDKLERAADVKRDATARGQQFSQHGLHIGKHRDKLAAVVTQGDTMLRKTSAWSDLPHLARGVLGNLQEHTIPALTQDIARHDAGEAFQQTNLFDSNIPFKARLDIAKRAHNAFEQGPLDERALATALRFGTMVNRSRPYEPGEDDRAADERHAESRIYRVLGDRMDNEGTRQGGAQRTARAEQIADSLLDLSARLNKKWRPGTMPDVTPALRDSAQRAGGDPFHDADIRQIGARRAESQPKLWGVGDFDNPHELSVDGKPLLIGRAHAPGQSGFLPARTAGDRDIVTAHDMGSLAHELGHATGTDMFRNMYTNAKKQHATSPWLAAAMLPEEFRAQMNAQDYMRDWSAQGIQGLPPDPAHMTPEQLAQHTLPLSTYADAAVRGAAPSAVSFARNLMRGNGGESK